MASNVTSYGATEGAGGLSQVERVVDTFIAPSKTFADILRNTSWWVPFLLVVILSLASSFVIDKQVGFDAVVQNTLHDNPKLEANLTEQEPTQRAAQIHKIANSYRYGAYGSSLLILLFAALGALALWGTFHLVLGAKTSFAPMFAVWMYAFLPHLLSSLLTMVTLFFSSSAEVFNIKNPIGTNPGFYLPDTAPWLRALLTSLDVFNFWFLALLILGTSIVTGVKRGQAAAVVLCWWVLIVMIGMAGAALAS